MQSVRCGTAFVFAFRNCKPPNRHRFACIKMLAIIAFKFFIAFVYAFHTHSRSSSSISISKTVFASPPPSSCSCATASSSRAFSGRTHTRAHAIRITLTSPPPSLRCCLSMDEIHTQTHTNCRAHALLHPRVKRTHSRTLAESKVCHCVMMWCWCVGGVRSPARVRACITRNIFSLNTHTHTLRIHNDMPRHARVQKRAARCADGHQMAPCCSFECEV